MNSQRLDKIKKYLKVKTAELIETDQLNQNGVDALNCSLDLQLDRANVSRDLNTLWKNGDAIKIQGKPVYYLDYAMLTQHYPDCFFPSVVGKDENFNNYLSQKAAVQSANDDEEILDSLDEIIGATGSLSEAVLNAKSAVSYPPYGIPCLIHGPNGVGKTSFSYHMINYARKKRNDPKMPVMTVYCQNYQDDPSLFMQALNGSEKKAGLKGNDSIFKLCENGVVILEQIQFLPFSCQNALASIINAASFHNILQSAATPLTTMIIATTDCDEQDERISPLSTSFPIHLQIKDIESRGIYEKIELILDLFRLEAKHIHTDIAVHKDIIALLAAKKFPGNLNQMRNEIQICCSKVYLENPGNKFRKVYVTYQALSIDLLSQSEANSKVNSIAISLLSCIESDYAQFNADGTSQSAAIFKNAPNKFNEHRLNQFVNELNIDVGELDNMENYVRENISVLKDCPPPQLDAIKKSINPYVYQLTLAKLSQRPFFSKLKKNVQLLYGILLHISNYLKRAHEETSSASQPQSITSQFYPNEYLLAKDIYQSLAQVYNFEVVEREIDFLCSYLVIATQWADHVNIAILLICHGDSVASQYVDYIKRTIEGNYILDCIDYNETMQLNDCLELASIKANQINQGAGVLVLTDIEPLTSIGSYIQKNLHIPCRTISNVSLNMLIHFVEASMSAYNNLDTVSNEIKMPEPSSNPTGKHINNFIDQIKDKVISKTVAFIDVDKAVSVLDICFRKTLQDLHIPYTDVLAVKYLCHCTNMLERVIRNETWGFQKINTFSNENYNLMHIVEHRLEYSADTFGVKIPSNEIAYVVQIFLLEK